MVIRVSTAGQEEARTVDPDTVEREAAQADKVAEAAERVETFLDARDKAHGLDPEDITAFDGNPLTVSDLRLLVAEARA